MADDIGRIAAHFELASQPVWLWDAARCRILWANAAGRAFWQVDSLFELAALVFIPGSPQARSFAETGPGRRAALTLPGGPLQAEFESAAVRVAGVENGRLIRLTNASPVSATASPALRGQLFTAAPAALCLMEANGAPIEANAAWRACVGEDAVRLGTLVGEAASARFFLNCIVNGQGRLSADVAGRRLRFSGRRLKRVTGGALVVYVQAEDVTGTQFLEALLVNGLRRSPEHFAEASGSESALASRLADSERRNAAKSEFLARLSHEMRNPLNAILGFSEIMHQHHFGPLGDAHYESYVADIHVSATHLLSLVNDLLDLARIEAGRLDLVFERVALSPLIWECVRWLEFQARHSGVLVRVSIQEDLPDVLADMRALKQILINVISNALKFTGSGGSVAVSAETNGEGGLVVTISDTGVGMSEADIQRALEPFGQVDGLVQRRHKGTGLGLPVTKVLTEANNARLHIESVPQHGTRVRIVFAADRVMTP